MAVDLSPLEDNDWLVCTDTGGITYKVSFENVKNLLAPRSGMDITIDTEVQVPGNTFFSLLTGGEPSKLSPGGEVDWGDGSPFGNLADSTNAGPTSYILNHEYATPGVYTIKIRSSFFFTVMGERSDIGGGTPLGTPAKIIKVGPFEPEYIERFGETLYPGSNLTNDPKPYFGILDYSWSGTTVPNDQDAYNTILRIDYTKLNQLAGTWGRWPKTPGVLQNWPKLDYSTIKTLRGTWLGSNILTWHNNEEMTLPVTEELLACWAECRNLTNFQKINIPNVTELSSAWRACELFTSFPELEYPSVKRMAYTWQGCWQMQSWGDGTETDLSTVTDFYFTWHDCQKLRSFPKIKIRDCIRLDYTWRNCFQLTEFPALDIPSTCSALNNTWENCQNLTSFPLINTSNVEIMDSTWTGCYRLTSFPALDTSNVTSMRYTWRGCNNLNTFEFIDTSNCRFFGATWLDLAKITSFPALDMSAGRYFASTWSSCLSLVDFPPNMFDDCTNMQRGWYNAWFQCALSVQSVENIMVSLDKCGEEGLELGFNEGTTAGYSTWTSETVVAFNNLIQKGWDIIYNP
jgi:hypothetical protein